MSAETHTGAARPPVAALPTHRTTVRPEWIDLNRHMNAAHYLSLVREPATAIHNDWDYGEDYRRRTNESDFVLRSEVIHLSEMLLGDAVEVATRLWALDDKRLRLLFEIRNLTRQRLAALVQYVVIHVELGPPPQARPFPAPLRERLIAVRDAHAAVPLPPGIERLTLTDRPLPADWRSRADL